MKFLVYYSSPSSLNYHNNTVILIKDNWDDWFHYETKYNLIYVKDGKRIDIGSVKIGEFQMETNQRTAKIPNDFTNLSEKFFSLGQSDYYYENIKNLGDSLRIDILEALNDIAYNNELYKKVKGLNVTRVSLMREVNDFMIKQQFSRIAHGKARLTEYDIEYTYPTTHMENPPVLTFRVMPDSNPPTNIHVIIGRNNVGKTYLIKNIIKSIYLDSPNNEFGILKSSNSLTGRLNAANGRNQAFANVLCVSFSPFDNYEDIITIAKRKSMPFNHIGLTAGDLNEILTRDFAQSLIQCQKSEYKISLLKKAIEILETDPIFERSNIKPLIIISRDDRDDVQKEEAIKLFKRLSSGHQVIILTLTRLVECITEKSLVILDEPENHLHPPLLAAFVRALSELLIDRNGVAVIATHSPVILQEVPRSCVWKINRIGNEVAISRLEIESFGATIGALTREVFGLEVTKSGFHKMLEDEVSKGKSYGEIIESFNNELGDEARLLLSTLLQIRD